MPRRVARLASVAALACAAPFAAPVAALAQEPTTEVDPPLEVVARGLANPRGLTVGPGGVVVVAEAGRGGDGPCLPSPEGGQACLGATGAITAVADGEQRRVLTGLPSLADPATGANATGPQDVALEGLGSGLVAVGLGADPARRPELGPGGAGLGQVHEVTLFGGARPLGDVAAYEASANPGGDLSDTNPTSVAIVDGRRAVVDAGGNDLLEIGAGGRISTLGVFRPELVDRPPFLPPGPKLSSQAVPTSVVGGPDGALYVGQLTGFPFPTGGAKVFRVRPGKRPSVYRRGFTTVIDIAFAPDRSLYVLQIRANGLLSPDRTGLLVRVGRNGRQTTVARDGLVEPTGLAVAPNGDLYVSNRGTSPDAGEVVRIPAPRR